MRYAIPQLELTPVVSETPRKKAWTNGDANKLSLEDRPAHAWYRFVLSYPPHLVRDYLNRYGNGEQHTVLDPFCGTGTTLVECKKLGVPSAGIEMHPMSHFATTVKVDWHPDPDGLIDHAQGIAEKVSRKLQADGVEDNSTLFLRETSSTTYGKSSLRSLDAESEKLLLTNSISPLPLHKTLVVLEVLQNNTDERFHRHELLAFAKALVFSISNLNFGPEVGVGQIKADAPVLAPWLENIYEMADGLRILRDRDATTATAYRGDSRERLNLLMPNSIDAVITSPPYPNEKDYTRTTRLESVLLGFIHNRAELQTLKHGLIRSNTRNVYKHDNDDQWVSEFPEIQRIAAEIEARRIELGKTSGFERLYARVTKLYFGGMARHLAELRTILRPGANLAYVVGDQASYLRVMIRTGQILASIAETLGYEVQGIDLFRTRLATATKEQLREEVLVFRWNG